MIQILNSHAAAADFRTDSEIAERHGRKWDARFGFVFARSLSEQQRYLVDEIR